MLQHQLSLVLITSAKLVWIEICYLSYGQWSKSWGDGGVCIPPMFLTWEG